MLTLKRTVEQKLMIGDRVTITVLQVKRDRVRLGVIAPPDIRIRRLEKAGRESHDCAEPL